MSLLKKLFGSAAPVTACPSCGIEDATWGSLVKRTGGTNLIVGAAALPSTVATGKMLSEVKLCRNGHPIPLLEGQHRSFPVFSTVDSGKTEVVRELTTNNPLPNRVPGTSTVITYVGSTAMSSLVRIDYTFGDEGPTRRDGEECRNEIRRILGVPEDALRKFLVQQGIDVASDADWKEWGGVKWPRVIGLEEC